MLKHFTAIQATPSVCELAESPIWDEREERLLWVDIPTGRIHAGRVHRQSIDAERQITLGGSVSAVALAEDGGLLAALDASLATIDTTGVIHRSGRLLPDGERRFNDVEVDPSGRLIAGSYALDDRVMDEVLLQVDAAGDMDTIRRCIGLSNGIGFSPDGRTIYHVDTAAQTVARATYSPTLGICGEFTPFISVEDGEPDGLAIDGSGELWIAIWGAGEVRHYRPDGVLAAVVDVDAPFVSSVTFAGPELDVLVITTAQSAVEPARGLQETVGGSLFVASPLVRGRRAHRWQGNTASPRWPA